MNSVVLLSVALPLLLAGQAWAAKALAPEIALKRGTELLEKHQFRKALVYLEQAEKAFPTTPGVYWKLGLANAELGRAAKAIPYWQKYRAVAPTDWQVFPKLIQAYQAQGDRRSRDREIASLNERRQEALKSAVFSLGSPFDNSGAALETAKRFCREKFGVAGKQVLAYQYFVPMNGAPEIRYQFSVVDEKRPKETTSLSLDYRGTFRIKEDEGAQHLVYFQFNDHPTYDVVRAMVVDILKGKAKPVAGITNVKDVQRAIAPDSRSPACSEAE